MIWEQYPWPIDVARMEAGNGYDFILSPQPATRLTPPLPPQRDVILNYPNEARVRATHALITDLLATQD